MEKMRFWSNKDYIIDLDSNNLDDLDILETTINKCNSSVKFQELHGNIEEDLKKFEVYKY